MACQIVPNDDERNGSDSRYQPHQHVAEYISRAGIQRSQRDFGRTLVQKHYNEVLSNSPNSWPLKLTIRPASPSSSPSTSLRQCSDETPKSPIPLNGDRDLSEVARCHWRTEAST